MNRLRHLLQRRFLSNVRGDVLGGLTAGVVALPLALGFGVASGLENGAAAGLYGAIAVGLIAAVFGGTPAQVSGPTGPMTVVVAALAVSLPDPRLVFLAIALGGALQVVLGLLRLGRFIQYVPYPVVSGFMSGIGVIIILLQLPVLFGLPPASSPLEGVQALGRVPAAMSPIALALGAAAIALIYLTPRLTRHVPGTLVALIVLTVVAVATGWQVPTIGAVPSGLPRPSLPAFDLSSLRVVLPAAVTLAMLGSIDSLLTSLVADKVTSTRHDSEQELIGQGAGNVVAGLLGGLAGAGATMRTVVNVRSGGRTNLSGVVHSLFLLAVLFGLGSLAARIPLAVLAGILITVGVGIIDYKGLRHLLRAPRGDSAVMLVVLVLTVTVDLIWAVAAGTVLASLMLVKRFADIHAATHAPLYDLAEHLRWEPPEATSDEVLRSVHVLRVEGPLFFGNALALQEVVNGLREARIVVLSFEGVRYLDQSGAYALEDLLRTLQEGDRQVLLAGVSGKLRAVLLRLQVIPERVPYDAVFEHKDDALTVATRALAPQSAARGPRRAPPAGLDAPSPATHP